MCDAGNKAHSLKSHDEQLEKMKDRGKGELYQNFQNLID